MNSSRRLPRKSTNAAAVLAVLIASVAMPAMAQQAPVLQIPGIAAPAPSGTPKPLGQAPLQAPAAAPVAPLPENASLGDAAARVKAMSSAADQGLDKLVSTALQSEQGKTSAGDLEKSNDSILLLTSKVAEAKLAVEYYETVKGKDDRAEDKLKALQADKDSLEKQLADLRQQQAQAAAVAAPKVVIPDPDPVYAEITGGKAKILIPYMGEIIAKAGDRLPNGQKVVSVSISGVQVVRPDGSKANLSKGTSVPRMRPQPAVVAGASAPSPLSR